MGYKKKEVYKIEVYFKNTFYAHDFFGYNTIKDLIQGENIKRSDVNSFHKVYNKPDYSYF